MNAAEYRETVLQIKRGRSLARQGCVTYRTPQRDIADVRHGGDTFRVTVSCGEWTCSCGDARRCAHIWAVFEAPDVVAERVA